MIMKIILACLLCVFVSVCVGQTDTTVFKQQKGFLFLSKQHHIYDWPNGDEVRTGFNDYFFPSDAFNKDCVLDSNKSVSFKNGLRVDFFETRNQLKSKSTPFNCKDKTGCYEYDKFYILPVIVDYKLYIDNWPPACRSDFFDIEVSNGSALRFYHQRKAITSIKITVIQPVANKKKAHR